MIFLRLLREAGQRIKNNIERKNYNNECNLFFNISYLKITYYKFAPRHSMFAILYEFQQDSQK